MFNSSFFGDVWTVRGLSPEITRIVTPYAAKIHRFNNTMTQELRRTTAPIAVPEPFFKSSIWFYRPKFSQHQHASHYQPNHSSESPHLPAPTSTQTLARPSSKSEFLSISAHARHFTPTKTPSLPKLSYFWRRSFRQIARPVIFRCFMSD